MNKIKNTIENNKEGKFILETIVAHNGVLVDVILSKSYERTEFDEIMADWRKQHKERQEQCKRSKIKLVELFTGKRKRSDIA